MGPRPCLYVAALALLWSPAFAASDQFKPMPLEPSKVIKAPQQKTLPSQKRQKLDPPANVQTAPPSRRPTGPAVIKPRTPPLAPPAPSAAPLAKPPAVIQANPHVTPPVTRPGTPQVGPPAMAPGKRPAAAGTDPIGPAVIDRDNTRLAPRANDPPSGSPDLTVSQVEIVSEEIRFRVRNQGPGEKLPGRINYLVTVEYFDLAGNSNTRTHRGVAGLTSLSRLLPGQQTGPDRVTRANLSIGGRMHVTVCINEDQVVAEENYGNNCLMRTTKETLSDLELVSVRFELYRRVAKKNKGSWWKRAGKWIWDAVTVEFDESGIPFDHIVLTIRNNGDVPVTNFEIKAGLVETGGLYSTTYTDLLQPGATTTAKILVASEGLWDKNGCCQGSAMVDPANKITEFEESNNKKAMTTIRIRDHKTY